MATAVFEISEYDEMPTDLTHRRVTTLTWVLTAVGTIGVGIGLIFWGSTGYLDAYPTWKAFTNNVGGVLLATGLISLLWELISKRSFLSEVFSVARLSEDIKTSGLHGVTTRFQHDIEWAEVLGRAKRIDVFVSYARTWRNSNLSLLRAFAERTGSQMNIVLPDPENECVLSELSRRYQLDVATMKERINETINEFKVMFDKKRNGKGQLSIWVTSTTPVFSFYRIDNKYIIATYRHRFGRGDVPTFICDRKGELTEFIDQEYASLTNELTPGVRKIFPAPKSTLLVDEPTTMLQTHTHAPAVSSDSSGVEASEDALSRHDTEPSSDLSVG